MFVVFGEKIIDSKDIKLQIEKNSEFNIMTDLSLGSKREDIIAFNMCIKIDRLKNILKEDGYELEFENKEDIINECMSIADDIALDLGEFLPSDSIFLTYAYKFEEVEDEIYLVFVMSHEDLGELKLNDVLKRILHSV